MGQDDILIGQIYDCAAAPELWPKTLEIIRERMNCAYVLAGFIDASFSTVPGIPFSKRWNTPWDEDALNKLEELLPIVPSGAMLANLPPDTAWSQLGHVPESQFLETRFAREWAVPQGLRDVVNTVFFKRERLFGMISAPCYSDRAPYDAKDRAFFESITPHIRRAIAISDIIDKGRLELNLQRRVIDKLSVAVFLVGLGRRIVFANAAAEDLLRKNRIVSRVGGTLVETHGKGQALASAIDKALKGDASLGLAGIGVPLLDPEGERSAAYVLPIGISDVRSIMGDTFAAIFIGSRGEQQPAVVEILRTLFNLTAAEARVVSLLVQGETPTAIAQSLGISITTIRSQLSQAYAKTGAPDQVALLSLVNNLAPKLRSV